MRNNKVIIAIVCFPILLICLWVSSLYVKIYTAKPVLIAVTGYDPRDLLSGHYVNLRPVWDKTDCSQFADNECPRDRFRYSYRFYLPEYDAILLDKIIGRTFDLNLHLSFAYEEGSTSSPSVIDMYIEGQPWKEWLDEYKLKQEYSDEEPSVRFIPPVISVEID